MGKTYRNEPSSKCYFKKQSHINRRKLEEDAEDTLQEYPHSRINRINLAKSRIANPWDDKVISHYRGQSWHRNNNDL